MSHEDEDCDDEMPSICPKCKGDCDFRDTKPDRYVKGRLICRDCWEDQLPNRDNDGYYPIDRL